MPRESGYGEARAALSLNRPDSSRSGAPLPLKGLAMADMKKAPNREGWALWVSTEPATGLGEGVVVGGDGFVDRLVRGQMLKLVFELAI